MIFQSVRDSDPQQGTPPRLPPVAEEEAGAFQHVESAAPLAVGADDLKASGELLKRACLDILAQVFMIDDDQFLAVGRPNGVGGLLPPARPEDGPPILAVHVDH